jgi:hypothetical protein
VDSLVKGVNEEEVSSGMTFPPKSCSESLNKGITMLEDIWPVEELHNTPQERKARAETWRSIRAERCDNGKLSS